LGVREPDMNSYVGPGKGGGSSWTISLIARGSSIGADRGVPSAVDGCGSLPMGDDIDAKGMGSGGNDDVLGNISVGGGVGLDTGGLGSDRGSLKTSGGGVLHDALGAWGGSVFRCITGNPLGRCPEHTRQEDRPGRRWRHTRRCPKLDTTTIGTRQPIMGPRQQHPVAHDSSNNGPLVQFVGLVR
jgi:hypothetical protein